MTHETGKLVDRLLMCRDRVRSRFNLAAAGIFIFTLYIFIQRWLELYPSLSFVHGVIVAVALLLVLAGAFDRGFLRARLTVVDLFWGAGVVLILVHIFLVRGERFDVFLYTSGLALLVLAKVDIDDFKPTFLLVRAGTLFYALGSILQFFFTEAFYRFLLLFPNKESDYIYESLVIRKYHPGFGFNRTALGAGFIATGLGYTLAFWNGHWFRKLVNLVLFVGLFFALYISGKRSLLVWAVLALPLTFIIIESGRARLKRLIVVAALGVAGVVSLFTLLQVADDFSFLGVRLELLMNDLVAGEATGSILDRLTIYRDAWAMFLENPLFGVGWKQFEVITEDWYNRIVNVHNVYLQLLTEMGLVGFVLVTLPLFYTYGITLGAINRVNRKLPEYNPLWKKGLVFSFFYQTLFLLYCLADNPLYEFTFILFYFLAIAIVNSFVVIEKRQGLKLQNCEKKAAAGSLNTEAGSEQDECGGSATY